MATVVNGFMREQLLDRRAKLKRAEDRADGNGHLRSLLDEVDDALRRMEDGSFGMCESCHETIEGDRLIADPLVRFCLDHMSRQELDALQDDLELAAQVQRGLLPDQNLDRYGWQICYHYEPAGIVSGDYCDVIDAGGDSGLYFMVGDVSGKGVAASMLTAHLHAMFRSLVPIRLPLSCMLQRASRVFSESTLPSHYATLVCGHAFPDGRVELANAGHPPPLVLTGGAVAPLEGSDVPVGMFANGEFAVTELRLNPGDGIVIYSDGVSEATDLRGDEYGIERIRNLAGDHKVVIASTLLADCRDDFTRFGYGAKKADDATLFVVGRTA
ncbi:MAG: SpoIIE family protein phosphatase [Bryobacteraceae bacterium]